MDGLTRYFVCCSIYFQLLSKIVLSDICNSTFCSEILLKAEPFYSNNINITVATQDKLSSLLCPPLYLNSVLFENIKCECNTTLDIYKTCFGDIPCEMLANGTGSFREFTDKCHAELENLCPRITFPTIPSTTTHFNEPRHKSTTQSSTSTRNTSGVSPSTTSTSPGLITLTPSTIKSSTNNEITTTIQYYPRPTDDETGTKNIIITVFVLGIISIIAATIGLYLYRQKRGTWRIMTREDQDNVIPLTGIFMSSTNGAESDTLTDNKEIENKVGLDTQKSCDSGVVCNFETNSDEKVKLSQNNIPLE